MSTPNWNTIANGLYRTACTTITNSLNDQITMPRPSKSSTSPGHFIGTTTISHPDIHPDWDCAVEGHLISFSLTNQPDEITIDSKTEIIPFVLEKIQGLDLEFSDQEELHMRMMRERNVNIREGLDLTFIYVGPSNHPKGSLGSGSKGGEGERGAKGKGGDGGVNTEVDGGFYTTEVDGGFNVIEVDGGANSRKRRHDSDT